MSSWRSHGGALRRLRYAVAGVALVAALAAAGVLVAQALETAGQQTATGIVERVASQSAVDLTAFTLRTSQGQLIEFALERLDQTPPAFPAVHLRAHLASALAIMVTYRREDGRNVALRLVDASLPP